MEHTEIMDFYLISFYIYAYTFNAIMLSVLKVYGAIAAIVFIDIHPSYP